jgi:hypothetical protein
MPASGADDQKDAAATRQCALLDPGLRIFRLCFAKPLIFRLQHESLAARFREPAPILMRNPNERDPNRTNFTTESGAVVHTDSVDSIDSQDDISRIGVPHEFSFTH